MLTSAKVGDWERHFCMQTDTDNECIRIQDGTFCLQNYLQHTCTYMQYIAIHTHTYMANTCGYLGWMLLHLHICCQFDITMLSHSYQYLLGIWLVSVGIVLIIVGISHYQYDLHFSVFIISAHTLACNTVALTPYWQDTFTDVYNIPAHTSKPVGMLHVFIGTCMPAYLEL